ncbi:MAG TPA: hypothetical protein ENI64_10280 [Gammaproteobacteria bacterium]|nr:hypothetical protein [Gammaproteobacteria bacterium]
MELELEPIDDNRENPGEQPLGKQRYEGAERRVAQRRCGHDRRDAVRYEQGSDDRRGGTDRRAPDMPWDKGHTL